MRDKNHRRLTISQGPLGPILPCVVDVRPFTVLIGKQGTGKSLLSQVLYFFENISYLVPYYDAILARGSDKLPGSRIVQTALDDLRTSGEPLSTFVNDSVTLAWEPTGDDVLDRLEVSIVRQPGTFLSKPIRRTRYRMNGALRSLVQRARRARPPEQQALFIPAERVLYSQASGPSIWQLLSLPSTLRFFADILQLAGKTFSSWEGGDPDTEEARWVRRLAEQALAGQVARRNDVWHWTIQRGDRPMSFRIDMASSGQRASWPLVVLAQVVFSWRKSGQTTPPSTIYVEEPEIHLHPEAQVAMVKLLAFLVHHGFRVVVTTHSLTVLYALNNLVLASSLGETVEEGVPEPDVRLDREQVAAYALQPDGAVKDLVDRETGFLSEVELGQVAAALGDEMNLIAMLRDRVKHP